MTQGDVASPGVTPGQAVSGQNPELPWEVGTASSKGRGRTQPLALGGAQPDLNWGVPRTATHTARV